MILDLVLKGREIKYCVTRFTIDGACLVEAPNLNVSDFYDNYAYAITDGEADVAIAYLDSVSVAHGSKEDITPSAEAIAWLAVEEATGQAGKESKSDIYVKFLVDFPGTTCIQAI